MQPFIPRTRLVIGVALALVASMPAFAGDGSLTTQPSVHRQKNASAYFVTGGNSFGKLDLPTGKYRLIGQMNGLPAPLGGLGRVHGKLYGGAIRTGNLYRIDRRIGFPTLVGVGGISYFITGSTWNSLYAVGQDLNLYKVDPESGATTLIGPTGFDPQTAGGGALSSGAKKLYMSATVLGYYDATLYELDLTTGAATAIGPMGSGTGAPPMVFERGVPYAVTNFPSQQVCRVDTNSGALSCFANVSGSPGFIGGLAPVFRSRDFEH